MSRMRDQFEIAYSRQQGHMVRSRLLFHRNAEGRYSNHALELQWTRYKREHAEQTDKGAA